MPDPAPQSPQPVSPSGPPAGAPGPAVSDPVKGALESLNAKALTEYIEGLNARVKRLEGSPDGPGRGGSGAGGGSASPGGSAGKPRGTGGFWRDFWRGLTGS